MASQAEAAKSLARYSPGESWDSPDNDLES